MCISSYVQHITLSPETFVWQRMLSFLSDRNTSCCSGGGNWRPFAVSLPLFPVSFHLIPLFTFWCCTSKEKCLLSSLVGCSVHSFLMTWVWILQALSGCREICKIWRCHRKDVNRASCGQICLTPLTGAILLLSGTLALSHMGTLQGDSEPFWVSK